MSWWQTCQYPVNQPVLLVSGFPLQLLPGADNLELCINPNDDHMSESEYSSDLFTLHYDRCSIMVFIWVRFIQFTINVLN